MRGIAARRRRARGDTVLRWRQQAGQLRASNTTTDTRGCRAMREAVLLLYTAGAATFENKYLQVSKVSR